jgi:hypothetical protein
MSRTTNDAPTGITIRSLLRIVDRRASVVAVLSSIHPRHCNRPSIKYTK